MSIEKVYISGQISGLTEEEFTANFAHATWLIQEEGLMPVSPLEVKACVGEVCASGETFANGEYRHTWQCYMKHDIKMLMECDAIAMMPNWRKSQGAILEHEIAVRVGMPIFSIEMEELIEVWQP